MTVVKGSDQYKVKVVTYNPWRRSLVMVAVVVSLALAIVVSFSVGKYSGVDQHTQLQEERDALAIASALSENEIAQLRQQVANLSLGSEVDQRASEEVRAEVIALKAQIAVQQEDIGFYRGLMSPTENSRGLTIGSWDLSRASGGEYQYKLVLQQLATIHNVLNGSVGINVIGYQNGDKVTYTLKELSEQNQYGRIKLKFKYFQTINGRLQLPEGFEPDYVEVMAESHGSNATKVDKKFGWFVQEV